MNFTKINQSILIMSIAFLLLGLCPPRIEAQTVKGTTVKKVEIGKISTKEGTLVQTGAKEWTHYHGDGKLFVKYRETNRDEWSVYLSSSRFSSVIINLWKKTFVMKQGNTVFYTGKILTSSNVASSENSSTSNLEQQCFNAVQGKVVWDKNTGNKTWGSSYIKRLCKRTPNPSATVACVNNEIQSHNNWNRAIEACRMFGTTPKASTNSVAQREQQCFNSVQGKLLWDKNTGNKTWGTSYIKELCKNTPSPSATIACFSNEIQSHNGWRRGIDACKSNPTVAKAGNSTTTNPTSTKTFDRAAAVAKKRSPLTGTEMAKVMQWISIKTSAARMPFCWRQSFGRTAGKPMICQAGYKQDTAGLCYKPCNSGEKGIATFCYKNCPAGFRDDGLYCGKPKAYGRGTGFPWKIGDRVGSLDGARARCSAKNQQGCEKYGAIIYPKCKAGFKNAGSNICSPICPNGFSDIGVSCKKPNYARDVKPLTRCAGGLQKDGALCYPACESGRSPGYQQAYNGAGPRNNYKGVGPVCWQNCPIQQNVNCGAGCATTKGQCAKAVFKMTSTPIIAALKIAGLVATGGASSAATGGAAAAANGSKLAASSPKLIKLASMVSKIKKLYEANKNTIKIAAGTYTVVTSLQSEVNLFSKEFADNFGEMTTPEIEKEIDRRFSREAALAIKKEWAIHHLSMNMEANVITTSKNFISVASIADPTGLSSVVNAFLNPLCKESTPFPTVRPKY